MRPYPLLKTLLAVGILAVSATAQTPGAPKRVSVAGQPEFVANCILSKVGYGMYRATESSSELTRIATTPAFNGGAAYAKGKYYGCDYDYDSNSNLTKLKWYVYDADTWQLESETDCPLDFSYIACDRTYDATTGRIYSINYDSTGNSIWLASTALADGTPNLIAQLSENVITIAAAPDGQLYGIDTTAKLWKISKTDAKLTLVGATNIIPDYNSDYTQSITIDPKTGLLYWAEFHTEGIFTATSAIYEVNTSTAVTRKVMDLPGNPELVGLYVADYAAAGVPGSADSLHATPQTPGSLQYSFSFKTPGASVDDVPLLPGESMQCAISIDGRVVETIDAMPGAQTATGIHTVTAGTHTLKITCSNPEGTGPAASIVFFAGWDLPSAVGNLKAEPLGNQAVISWNAPALGANGGDLRGPLTYEVVRMPGNVSLASGISGSTYTDNVADAGRYSYKVTATSPEGRGPAAESAPVVLGTFSLPYNCAFDTRDEFNLYTIVDVKSQGKVWNYDDQNKRLRHPWAIDNEIDDFAVSPALATDASKVYEISFDACQMVASYNEHVELWFGPSADPVLMTKVLDTGKLTEEPQTYKATVVPTGSGPHHFAFRSNTGKGGFMSYVDNVSMAECGLSSLPAEVSDVEVFGAPNGVLAVDIAFRAPSTDMRGQALASIIRCEVARDGNQSVKSFAAPQPGALLTFRDSGMAKGEHTYTIVTVTAEGSSLPVTVEAFAGEDLPLPPTDVTLSGSPGNRVITWTAPTRGQNGGNMEGLLSFKIERVVNGVAELIAEDLQETEYTDTWESESQAAVYYNVYSETPAGDSEGVSTSTYTAGRAYPLPYAESFTGGTPTAGPWDVEQVAGEQGSWTFTTSGQDPYCKAQDNDGGMATFDGYHSWTNGCELRLISPAIDFSQWADPKLTFWMYHFSGQGWSSTDPVNETMTVEVSADNGPFRKVSGADFPSYASKDGWQTHSLDLSDWKGTGNVRIAFRGRGAGCFNMHIDNISLDATEPFQSGLSTPESAGTVRTVGRTLSWAGLEGTLLVADAAGRIMALSHAPEGVMALEPGLYIVVIGNTNYKFIIK